MKSRIVGCGLLLLMMVFVKSASADILLYQVPGTNLVITLRGTYDVKPGGNAFYRHPKLGRLVMNGKDVLEKYRVPDDETLLQRLLIKVKDAESALEAGKFALSHGMVEKVYECAEMALEHDANNVDAHKILELRKIINNIDLGDSAKEEADLRKAVSLGKMKVAKSRHFILLHDTPDEPDRAKGRVKTRSEERLELLELVYESFLLKFYSEGVELEIPQERLKVVLFNEEADYNRFATSLDPQLSSAIGFWDPKTNISFFFDHGSSDDFRAIRGVLDDLQRQVDDLIRRQDKSVRDLKQMVESLTLLVEIDRENSDIEVVSHECTHQMAGNTGLFPRHIMTPSWVHEGLATYFEAPSEASWSGIGAVNKTRIGLYRALAEGDPEHSHIDFIVGDQIFDYAASHMGTLHGYSQAWALTHFLVEEHFEELMEFYKRLGEMPADISISADTLTYLFDEVFEADRDTLNLEYHSYMRSIKTDLEEALGN